MSNNALRYNQGKPDYTLVDYKALEPMVRVLEFGAKKYARDNCRKGLSKENILGSLQRHVGNLIDKVNSGKEEVDSETLLHEIGHILCNGMFYSALYVNEENKTHMSKDNIDWDALDRAEQAASPKSAWKSTSTKKEEPSEDWEHKFYLENGRFPVDQEELDDFIAEMTDSGWEEEPEEEEYYEEESYDYEEEEEEEEVDDLDFSGAADPIQAMLDKADAMERAARPRVTQDPRASLPQAQIVPTKKEKPVIVLQKTEKIDSFVDGFVKNDPRVRGLGFRTQDLL